MHVSGAELRAKRLRLASKGAEEAITGGLCIGFEAMGYEQRADMPTPTSPGSLPLVERGGDGSERGSRLREGVKGEAWAGTHLEVELSGLGDRCHVESEPMEEAMDFGFEFMEGTWIELGRTGWDFRWGVKRSIHRETLGKHLLCTWLCAGLTKNVPTPHLPATQHSMYPTTFPPVHQIPWE